MVIVFSYKGNMDSVTLRANVISRYNEIVESPIYVRLFYDNGAPYLTGNKYISITHTNIGDERIEQIAIGDTRVGIDVERMDRTVKTDIANRYFNRDEVDYIGGNNAKLVEVWQRKEALGKSQSIGISHDNVIGIEGFREYELYRGYRTTLYALDDEIFFVAM